MDTTLYLEKEMLCRKRLDPFFDMLYHRRDSMTPDQWLALLSKTESRVTQNPEQYLGNDIPEAETTIKIVKDMFSVFREQNLTPP